MLPDADTHKKKKVVLPKLVVSQANWNAECAWFSNNSSQHHNATPFLQFRKGKVSKTSR
jgi:hypothetical protein